MKYSVKTIIRPNGDITYYLPSILFNNKKPVVGMFSVFLIVIIFSNIVSHIFNDKFLFFLFYFPISLAVLYLISPRTLVLKEDGIQYYSFWKKKWKNIKNFSLKNDILTLRTLEEETLIIKNINSNISKEIIEFINKKLDVTA